MGKKSKAKQAKKGKGKQEPKAPSSISTHAEAMADVEEALPDIASDSASEPDVQGGYEEASLESDDSEDGPLIEGSSDMDEEGTESDGLDGIITEKLGEIEGDDDEGEGREEDNESDYEVMQEQPEESNEAEKKRDLGDESGDSDDEEVLIRTGNVPKHWYDDYDHVGYSVDGKTVAKPQKPDELAEFIRKQNDPEWWREITDDLNNTTVRLTNQDLEMIQRIRQRNFAEKDVNPFDENVAREADFPDAIHPLNDTVRKDRFIRSKWERKQVNKYLQAIRRGWLKVKTEEERQAERDRIREMVWDIW